MISPADTASSSELGRAGGLRLDSACVMIGDGATSDVQALPNDIAQVRSDEVGLSRFSQLVDRRPRDARQTSQEHRRGRELAPEAPDGVAHVGGTARVEVAQTHESDAADLKTKQILG